MNFTPEQVELVVQRVLEHLGTPGGAAPVSASSPAAATPASRGVPIGEQVVTQALLAEAINGSKLVRIGPKAILTPLARDFVRKQGLEIIRESPRLPDATAARWQIIVTTSTPQIAGVVEGVKQNGIPCELRLSGTAAEAAGQAISALCRGEATKVVVFTGQPELAACLANRNERIRAAAITEVGAGERVRSSLNPNFLSIDPTAKGGYELKTYLKAFIP